MTWSIDLDDEKRIENEVIYPEIGYFELARAIDNLKAQYKTTKGSRMSDVWILPVGNKKTFTYTYEWTKSIIFFFRSTHCAWYSLLRPEIYLLYFLFESIII